MKKIISLSIVCLLATFSFAQAPQFMNYQAVARNNSGVALANQTIKVRLSVLKNAVQQYSETRQVTTNALGLFNVQIGSSGAISTTGTFNTIDWLNNAAPGYVLKVELDINNSGLYTDMGNTPFSSVPFAFVADKADKAGTADNAEKIGGHPVDVTTPTVGNRLAWNGTAWTPVKKDTVIQAYGSSVTIAAGGTNAPWAFAGATPSPITGATKTITVTGNETITGTFVSAFGHTSTTSSVTVSFSVCYQEVGSGSIIEFYPGTYAEIQIPPNERRLITTTGAIKLPAGTYKIGLGIKNRANAINLSDNMPVTGVVEIRY
jgi:hypothetical protein